MPSIEIADPKTAQEAYAVWRGSLHNNDRQELFPNAWEGLPKHYRDVLSFVAGYAALHNIPGSD